jgi:hypothetical protein
LNRREARKRFEQILESANAMLVDGRCPKCGAIGQVGDRVPEVPLSAEDQRDLQINHRQGCPMNEDIKEAALVAFQFRLDESPRSKYVMVQGERGPVFVFRPDKTKD